MPLDDSTAKEVGRVAGGVAQSREDKSLNGIWAFSGSKEDLGPSSSTQPTKSVDVYKSPCVGLSGNLFKVSKEPLEPWGRCACGERVLRDDESRCWEVAECQVPALLQDGGPLWHDVRSTEGLSLSDEALLEEAGRFPGWEAFIGAIESHVMQVGSFPAIACLAFINETLLAKVSGKEASGKFSSPVWFLGGRRTWVFQQRAAVTLIGLCV